MLGGLDHRQLAGARLAPDALDRQRKQLFDVGNHCASHGTRVTRPAGVRFDAAHPGRVAVGGKPRLAPRQCLGSTASRSVPLARSGPRAGIRVVTRMPRVLLWSHYECSPKRIWIIFPCAGR